MLLLILDLLLRLCQRDARMRLQLERGRWEIKFQLSRRQK